MSLTLRFAKEYKVEMSSNTFGNYDVIELNSIDEKSGKILLSREYRREQGKYDYRLPGGKVIDTIAEMRAFDGDIISEATDAAIREAREEAGVIIHHPELIHTSHCGANIEWDLYYFLATHFEYTGEHERDDE